MQSGGPSKKVPDLKCEVQDLLLEVVDLKQEVPDLRSGGIPPPNLTPASPSCPSVWVVSERVCVWGWSCDVAGAGGADVAAV